MTSTKAPFGFRPLRRLGGGGENTMGVTEYRIANGFNSNLFTGDPVKLTTDGTIVLASVSTDYIQGIFMGCRYVDSVTKQPRWSRYWPAGTSSADGTNPGPRALVMTDPQMNYLVQAVTSVTVGAIGLNIGVTIGVGNTLTGRSAFGVDPANGLSATGVGPWRVIDIYDTPDNSFTDAYPVLEVRLIQNAITRVSAG
jgi:hypothetical protein